MSSSISYFDEKVSVLPAPSCNSGVRRAAQRLLLYAPVAYEPGAVWPPAVDSCQGGVRISSAGSASPASSIQSPMVGGPVGDPVTSTVLASSAPLLWSTARTT